MVVKQTVLIVLVMLNVALQTQGESAAPSTLADPIDAIMDRAESTGDFHQAAAEALSLFSQVTVWCETTDGDQFLEAAYASRLLSQLDLV